MNHEGLDEIDKKILELLKANARMSFSEIGERIGITRVSVKNRMSALEKQGVIRGYHAEIDPTMVPDGVRFLLDIEALPEHYEDVLEELAGSKMIRQIYGLTGECKIHAVGFSPNQKQLNYYASQLYRTGLGVRRVAWHEIIATYKDMDGGVDYVRYQKPEHLED